MKVLKIVKSNNGFETSKEKQLSDEGKEVYKCRFWDLMCEKRWKVGRVG